MDIRSVCIASYGDELSAEVSRSLLESNKIYAFVSRDDCGGMRPHLNLSTGFRLIVKESDLSSALEILNMGSGLD